MKTERENGIAQAGAAQIFERTSCTLGRARPTLDERTVYEKAGKVITPRASVVRSPER
jgi:hypothetical protein